MNLSRMALAAAATGMLVVPGFAWDDIVNHDFESPAFTLGPLNGQNGWQGAKDLNGAEPMVVANPDQAASPQCVELLVTGNQGDWSEMTIMMGQNLLDKYTKVKVSFDIYRTGTSSTDQNLWWWWVDAGTPTYGLQWDSGGTLPHGWNPGANEATTVFGRWASLEMEWDFNAMNATSMYDGQVVDTAVPISDITSLTGWTIHFGHEAATSGTGDVAYIDNFSVQAVPEPATLWAVGAGLAALLAKRRR